MISALKDPSLAEVSWPIADLPVTAADLPCYWNGALYVDTVCRRVAELQLPEMENVRAEECFDETLDEVGRHFHFGGISV